MAIKRRKLGGKKTGTAVVPWDEELAKFAAEEAAQEKPAGGKFFSTAGGQLSIGGNSVKNNELICVIVDHAYDYTYYEGRYDPDSPTPPKCFALGHDEKEMAPHESVVERDQEENDQCKGCPMNEWGSAETGKGKACQNRRRLALLPCGSIDKHDNLELIEDLSHYRKGEIGYLRIPVTSLKNYSNYIRELAATEKRPAFAMVTRIFIEADRKTQFKICFEAIDRLPNEITEIIYKERRPVVHDEILLPYNLDFTEAEEEKPAHSKRSRKY